MEIEYNLPPGFRFFPSDEELIVHYLQNKVICRPIPASIIADIDLYKYNPWDLPKKALFGEDEWYFFTPRDRKYPNGVRPNRAAGSGYWKATGTDKPIPTCSASKIIGVKKALVFYVGRPPKGTKTEWIMNEYRLLSTTIKPSKSKGSMRLDDWVLCRVRRKGNRSKNTSKTQESPSKEVARHLPKMEDSYAWARHLPKMEDPCEMYNANYKTDMIADCLNQDCQLLDSILSGQSLPPINETISCVTIQGNKDNSFMSGYEDSSVKLNSPVAVSSFNNYNLVDEKHNDEDRYDNFLALSNRNVNLLPNERSHNEFYNNNTSDPILSFMELNELAFTAKYLQ